MDQSSDPAHVTMVRDGTGTVVVGPQASLLLATRPNDALTLAVASALLAGMPLAEALEDGAEGDDLPALGAAERSDDGWTLLLRGAAHAEVRTGDGAESTYRAGGTSRWNRIPLHDPETIDVFLTDAATGAPRSMGLGLTAGSAMTIHTDAALTSRPDGNDGPSAPTQHEPHTEDRATPEAEQRSATPEQETDTEADDDAAAVSTPLAGAPASDTEEGPAAELDFHHLFEETTFRAPEAEAEAPSAPGGADTVDGPATSDDEHATRVFDADEPPAPPEPVQPPESADPAPPAPEPPNNAGAGALIDWVPGATRNTPPPPPSPSPTVLEPTHFARPQAGPTPPVDRSHLPPPPDTAPMGTPPVEPPTTVPMPESGGDDEALEEATITVAALRAAREAAATTDPASTVAALRCPTGHPNPTHADSCRSCGQTIADRTPQTIARPTLGRLRLPDGTYAPLDRHLLIGRSPATDIAVRDEPTGTVRLADPDKVLSRTHAAVVLDGWQVLVVDRDSMNHTYVRIPGRDPFQLRPGEPCPVPPGTAIRLGDEIEVVFEAEAP